MGGLFGSEGGPDRVRQLMALYQVALRTAPDYGARPAPRAALMTAGYCHEDPRIVAERGTELVAWYIEQQRERAACGDTAASDALAWKCGITCSPKRRRVWSTSSCCAGPTAHSKMASSIPKAS